MSRVVSVHLIHLDLFAKVISLSPLTLTNLKYQLISDTVSEDLVNRGCYVGNYTAEKTCSNEEMDGKNVYKCAYICDTDSCNLATPTRSSPTLLLYMYIIISVLPAFETI